MNTYLVGGAVRDKLLGYPIKERDWVVVGSTPELMLNQGYRQVGRDFPVFLHPKTNEEYALARTERKSGQGYTGFTCFSNPDVTLEEDLKRRDLTINAMAESESGDIIDPYGGQQDLTNRILRHVSPAFTEDPLRILRIARFAARFANEKFTLAPETMQLIIGMVTNGEVTHLVPERIWQETEKALNTDNPSVYFQVLRSCGALAELMPELDQLFGVPQPKEHHPEIDTGIHTLLVLEQATLLSKDPKVRFAALCHDFGKGTTPKSDWPRHIGHEDRSVALINQLTHRIKLPKHYQTLAKAVAKYHTHCHRAAELKPSTLLTVLEKIDAFRQPERLKQFLLACEADFRGRPGYTKKKYSQVNIFQRAFHAAKNIMIDDLLELGLPGEALGKMIREKRIAAIKETLHDK